MNLTEAIETLEAEGFHMYRRLLSDDKHVGAELVYTPADIWCQVFFNGDKSLLDLGNGDWIDVDNLKDALPTMLMESVKELDAAKPTRVSLSVQLLEMAFPEKLAKIEKETRRKLDFLWEGRTGNWMVLYRGAVFEINNHLRVIALDYVELTPIDMPDDYSEEGPGAGVSLQKAFAMVDEIGGFEERQVEITVQEEVEA